MKAIYKLTAILLFIAVGFTSCNKAEINKILDIEPAQPILLSARQIEKLNATNSFSFKIFREVSRLQEEPNTFFSPLSLNLALGMLYNGTTGETRAEMAKVLGMGHFTDAEINEYFQKMMQALLSIDQLTEISIANSIWYRDSDCFYVKQSFKDINQRYFDAVVRGLDFNRPDAADIINQWCSDKTNGRITEIIEAPIHPDAVMYLINALYFKSKWKFEFDRAHTRQEDFTTANGQTRRVNMMTQTAGLRYYRDQYLRAVELPYGNEAFSMVLILPDNNMSIDELVEHLDSDTWQNIVENLREQNVHLKLPRFRVESDIDLEEPVRNTGIQRIFYGGLQNIGRSTRGPLFVSNILQKTFVEVNEEGTEAAAVTAIEVMTMSLIPGAPIPFFADRPFLYLIRERSTGTILFIGRMDEPTE